MKKLFILLFVVSNISFAQTVDSLKISEGTAIDKNPNETILKYQQFLQGEAKNYREHIERENRSHREFVEGYYDQILTVFGFLGLLVGSVLTWLNWKSKENISRQVDEQFRERGEEIINDKISEIDGLLIKSKEKSDNQFRQIGKLLMELSKKSKSVNDVDESTDDVDLLNKKEILWVDDYPDNNNYPRQMMEDVGIGFTLSLSTEDAKEHLNHKTFDLIISDMGRGPKGTAGLDLLELIREMKIKTPTIIYASRGAIRSHGPRAKELGAVATLTGVTTILREIQKILMSK